MTEQLVTTSYQTRDNLVGFINNDQQSHDNAGL
jgi:hypothetical protein